MTVRLKDLVRRPVPWALMDGAIVALAFYVAFLFRFLANPSDNLPDYFAPLNTLIVPFCFFYAGCNYLWGLHRRAWQYASGQEVVSIAWASICSTLIVAIADVALGWTSGRPLPLSVILLGGFFAFTGFVTFRYRARLRGGFFSRWPGPGGAPVPARTRTLIYGAGQTGQLLARRLLVEQGGNDYSLTGFIDDDRSKRGLRIHGIEVLGGRRELARIVEERKAELIILAMARIGGEDLRDIVAICQDTPAQIRIIPNMFELMVSPNPGPLVREVGVEDLLGRKPVALDSAACRRVLAGKVALVTGGCGSIGSELCRQIAAFEPSRLVILDNNETGVYDLEVELGTRFPSVQRVPVIADVTDRTKLAAVFRDYAPQVVFHAAAYKHVPLMESHPEEAVRVNVGGTCAVVDAALAAGVEQFIMISTDKAVNPESVMGASKRIAERLVLAAGLCSKGRYSAVRFGNVLGSRGSVVPTFARQIQLGGPVTVTHPDVTRYFMEISEAVSLVLQAAAMAEGGDTFMLDMGEQIRVDDLARRMIRLRGLRPDVDISISYVGLRPGEKLQEELHLAGEDWGATAHPAIFRYGGNGAGELSPLREAVDSLVKLAVAGDRSALRAELMRLAVS